jgi:hypothetical protein
MTLSPITTGYWIFQGTAMAFETVYDGPEGYNTTIDIGTLTKHGIKSGQLISSLYGYETWKAKKVS